MRHIDLIWKFSTFCDTVWYEVPKMVLLDALCCLKFFRHFVLCAWECHFHKMSHLVDVSMKIQLAHKFSPCFNGRQKIKFWKLPILKGFIFDCKAAPYKLPTNEKISYFFFQNFLSQHLLVILAQPIYSETSLWCILQNCNFIFEFSISIGPHIRIKLHTYIRFKLRRIGTFLAKSWKSSSMCIQMKFHIYEMITHTSKYFLSVYHFWKIFIFKKMSFIF